MFSRKGLLPAILIGGLIAGALDLWAAMLISGKPMSVILHFIASGLIGKAAFAGGMQTAVLGLGLQLVMGLIIAAVYCVASLRQPLLRRRWVAMGLAYGAPIYVVMNYVIMPLSRIGRTPAFEPAAILKNLAAMLAFGLIVAAAARWRIGRD